jgi:hypothetical protein
VGGTSSTGGAPTGGKASGGAFTGGKATGGNPTGGVFSGGGGNATGGSASAPSCATVISLPNMGAACSAAGESQCDKSGNQCVCERGIWYCNTVCASTYPTEPTPNSACYRGAACNYPSGVGCSCVNLSWFCLGSKGCPAAAGMPLTGDSCNGLTGVACDYPNSSPALHFTCYCMVNADAGTGSTWVCAQSSVCPTTQPAYSQANACPGFATCSYGSIRCACLSGKTPWVCGLAAFPFNVDR